MKDRSAWEKLAMIVFSRFSLVDQFRERISIGKSLIFVPRVSPQEYGDMAIV
jgi:hypothetical protein